MNNLCCICGAPCGNQPEHLNAVCASCARLAHQHLKNIGGSGTPNLDFEFYKGDGLPPNSIWDKVIETVRNIVNPPLNKETK